MPHYSLSRLLLLLALVYIIYLHLTRAPTHQSKPPSLIPSTPERPSPAASEAPIPRKIWQTAATCLPIPADRRNGTSDDKTLEGSKRISSWVTQNPDWRYECLSDESAAQWVKEHFRTSVRTENDAAQKQIAVGQPGDDLSWVGEIYLALKDPILKADLLRYLLLYIEGGLYTDIDTTCNHPISTWIANNTLLSTAQIILGIESDRQPVENDWKLYSDARKYIWGIANWTLASRAGHPFLRTVIEMVGKKLLALAEKQGKELGEMQVLYHDVIETSGPRAFSEAFVAYLRTTLRGDQEGWKQLSMLEEPKMVGEGVLVLPIRAFSVIEANRVDGEGARSLEFENMVRHWSDGGWKQGHLIDDRVEKGGKPEGWEEVKRVKGID